MNVIPGLERSLATWLERDGPDQVPGRVIKAALAEARTVRQRPAWTIDRLPTLPVLRAPLRLEWIAIALMALLALLGGLVMIGALQHRSIPTLSACPAGSMPDQPGPADQARPADAPTSVIWDAVGDDGILAFTAEGTWTFDVCSNTWRRLGRSIDRWNDTLVYDVDSHVVVGIGHDGVWSYDVGANTETRHGTGPSPRGYGFPRAIYDPVTGLVVVLDQTFIWTYDVESDRWREIVPVGQVGPDLSDSGYSLVAYDRSANRIVLYKTGPSTINRGMRTWEFDLRARSWTQTTAVTPFLNLGWFARDEIVYDEANERTLLFSDGGLAAYDATADTWDFPYGTEFLGGARYGPYNRRPAALAYDPLNRRLVVFGGDVRTKDRGWVTTDDVIAFDLRTREWIELLTPSLGGPS